MAFRSIIIIKCKMIITGRLACQHNHENVCLNPGETNFRIWHFTRDGFYCMHYCFICSVPFINVPRYCVWGNFHSIHLSITISTGPWKPASIEGGFHHLPTNIFCLHNLQWHFLHSGIPKPSLCPSPQRRCHSWIFIGLFVSSNLYH